MIGCWMHCSKERADAGAAARVMQAGTVHQPASRRRSSARPGPVQHDLLSVTTLKTHTRYTPLLLHPSKPLLLTSPLLSNNSSPSPLPRLLCSQAYECLMPFRSSTKDGAAASSERRSSLSFLFLGQMWTISEDVFDLRFASLANLMEAYQLASHTCLRQHQVGGNVKVSGYSGVLRH